MFGIAVSLVFGVSLAVGDFDVDWHTIDGGGGEQISGHAIQLIGTIGQPDAAEPLSGGSFELTGGFWFALIPGDCNDDGGVNILDYVDLETCLTGPGASPLTTTCACLDFDDDNDVDLFDFAEFTVMYTGS